jgi:TRAP-type C4-dicarboxylate transport system permease small subunit
MQPLPFDYKQQRLYNTVANTCAFFCAFAFIVNYGSECTKSEVLSSGEHISLISRWPNYFVVPFILPMITNSHFVFLRASRLSRLMSSTFFFVR